MALTASGAAPKGYFDIGKYLNHLVGGAMGEQRVAAEEEFVMPVWWPRRGGSRDAFGLEMEELRLRASLDAPWLRSLLQAHRGVLQCRETRYGTRRQGNANHARPPYERRDREQGFMQRLMERDTGSIGGLARHAATLAFRDPLAAFHAGQCTHVAFPLLDLSAGRRGPPRPTLVLCDVEWLPDLDLGNGPDSRHNVELTFWCRGDLELKRSHLNEWMIHWHDALGILRSPKEVPAAVAAWEKKAKAAAEAKAKAKAAAEAEAEAKAKAAAEAEAEAKAKAAAEAWLKMVTDKAKETKAAAAAWRKRQDAKAAKPGASASRARPAFRQKVLQRRAAAASGAPPHPRQAQAQAQAQDSSGSGAGGKHNTVTLLPGPFVRAFNELSRAMPHHVAKVRRKVAQAAKAAAGPEQRRMLSLGAKKVYELAMQVLAGPGPEPAQAAQAPPSAAAAAAASSSQGSSSSNTAPVGGAFFTFRDAVLTAGESWQVPSKLPDKLAKFAEAFEQRSRTMPAPGAKAGLNLLLAWAAVNSHVYADNLDALGVTKLAARARDGAATFTQLMAAAANPQGKRS
jgi:hypothetical protein